MVSESTGKLINVDIEAQESWGCLDMVSIHSSHSFLPSPSISPGNIWTPLWEELAASTSDPRATILEGTLAQPLGRMGQPAEVAAAAVFLASEATFCTGLELLVTGGAELGYGRKASKSSLGEVPTLPPNVH